MLHKHQQIILTNKKLIMIDTHQINSNSNNNHKLN